MTPFVQAVLVVVIVAVAVAYAGLKLMPAALRRSLATGIAAWAGRAGLSEANARRVEAKLATGGACGSCDSCKACATSGPDASPQTFRTIPLRRASSVDAHR